ncbi:MAG: glucosamine-6-phosphate deaminase [Candidatus Hadarchaeales archaeon]
MGIRLVVAEDYEELSRRASQYLADFIRRPRVVLGLATGATPIGTYRELVRMYREGLDFGGVVTFNLDEFALPPDHPASCRRFMEEHLFRWVNIKRENIHFLDGMAEDPRGECERYEEEIRREGGIDLQLLGIGRDGHIALNGPGTPFDSRTRPVSLPDRMRSELARSLGSPDEVPHWGLTVGIATIMEAKEILLLASGEEKAEAVAKALEGPVTPELPASVLQLHPRCTFIVDRACASGFR